MSNEGTYYDVLNRIVRMYQTPAQLRRNAERQYGLTYEEALEMAYENIQAEASAAIRGRRRPSEKDASAKATLARLPVISDPAISEAMANLDEEMGP